jgi:hypothetical protein
MYIKSRSFLEYKKTDKIAFAGLNIYRFYYAIINQAT